MTTRHIVLVEDDPLQVEDLTALLEKAFPGAHVECLDTESRFYDWLDRHLESVPDIFVIDIMLRWTDPGPKMKPPPDDVKLGGIQLAGFRCEKRLAVTPQMRDVPVVFFSVLEEKDVEREIAGHRPIVRFLWKGSQMTLVEMIRSALKPV